MQENTKKSPIGRYAEENNYKFVSSGSHQHANKSKGWRSTKLSKLSVSDDLKERGSSNDDEDSVGFAYPALATKSDDSNASEHVRQPQTYPVSSPLAVSEGRKDRERTVAEKARVVEGDVKLLRSQYFPRSVDLLILDWVDVDVDQVLHAG
jgi:surfactin synthase thioesterase subunit